VPGPQPVEGWEGYVGAVLEDVEDAVVLLDDQGIIRTWNAAAVQILGWEPSEIIGRNARTLVPADREADRERIEREVERYGYIKKIETRALAKNGQSIPVSLTQTRLADTNAVIAGFTLVLRDRRETENMHRQLLRADRLATIGLLASTVAHEVGTPLNVILGRAEMLEQTLGEDHPARAQIATITAQIQRISTVVSRLLLFGRDAGPGHEPVQLNRVLNEVVAFVEPRLQAQNVELSRELDDELPTLAGDPGHFHQVFLNLVMNALDVMPEGGKLVLKTRICRGADHLGGRALGLCCSCLQAEVIDTGPGIAPEQVTKIFEPFFTTKKGGKGTGLGLAIAHEIVKKYDGQLRVVSSPGEGTAFIVSLALASRGAQVVQ
jgi:PAS domain S-box-containing protein